MKNKLVSISKLPTNLFENLGAVGSNFAWFVIHMVNLNSLGLVRAVPFLLLVAVFRSPSKIGQALKK